MPGRTLTSLPLIQFDAGTADTRSIALQLSSPAHDNCAMAQRRGDASILLLADRSGRQLSSTATTETGICHRSSARWTPPPCISQRNTAILRQFSLPSPNHPMLNIG
jgi:hypothetical protein